MYFKTAYIIGFLIWAFQLRGQTEALLVGKIDNPLAMEVVLNYNKDLFGFEKETYEAAIDDNNTFSIKLKLPEARALTLNYRNDAIKLFLQPGDTLKMRFDGNYFTETIQFEGNAAAKNTFLFDNRRYFLNTKETLTLQNARETLSSSDYTLLVDSIFNLKKVFFDKTNKEKFSKAFQAYLHNEVVFGRAFYVLSFNKKDKYPINAQWELRDIDFSKPEILQNEYAPRVIDLYLSYLKERFTDKYPHADTSVYEVLKSSYVQMARPYLTIKVFENPILSENILKELSKYEEAQFLNLKTTEPLRFTLKSVPYDDYFLRVKLYDGQIGWIEQSKVSLFEKRVDEASLFPRNCLNIHKISCDFDKVLAGKSVYYAALRETILSMLKVNADSATVAERVSNYLSFNRQFPAYNDLLRGAYKRYLEDKDMRMVRLNLPPDIEIERFSLGDKTFEEFANKNYKKPKNTPFSPYVAGKNTAPTRVFIQPSSQDSIVYLDEDHPLLRYEPSDKPFIFNGLAINDLVPPFKVTDIEGNEISFKNLLGKVIFMDFWATHCSPCLVQIPFTQRLIDKYKGQNIVFLYLSVDEDKTQWRQYLKTQNWAGIQAHDADIIPLNFGVQALPYTLLIDKNGRIAYNSLLNSKITAEQMIDVLLKK